MGVRAPAKTRQEVVKRKPKPLSSWTSFFLNVTARLSLYYAIYLYFWTCPKVSHTESPPVCRGGDWLKTILQPHVGPLYNEHLAQYVDKVSPYVKTANDKYFHPTGVFIAKQYDAYGKPRVEEAKVIVFQEYDKIVAPRIAKAVKQGNVYYDQYLADHVATGKEIYGKVEPHVSYAAGKAYEKGYPLYVASLPHAEAAWVKFVELVGWASVEGKGWVSRRWGMHVEPQLWRIQQKLGKKLAGDEAPESPAVTESNPSVTSAPNDSATANDTPVPAHLRPETRAAIEEDLKTWTAKFTAAGQKAIADVGEKLSTLCSDALEKEKAGTNYMLDALEDNIASELQELVSAIDELSASSDAKESKELAVAELVKTTSLKIQNESKKIHTHSQDTLSDVYDNTRKIVDAALAVLGSVHDLGMQELGMKWAWMDGVTYKDWSKYNELKSSFEGSRQSVIRAGQSNKGLREFTEFTHSVESETKEIVNEASKKLSELQQNGLKETPKQEHKTPEAEEPTAEESAPEEPAEEVSKIREMGHEIDNHGHVVGDDNHDEDAPPHKHVHPESERLMDAVNQQILQAEEDDAHSDTKVRAKSSLFAEAKKQDSAAEKVQSALSEASKAASEAIYGKQPKTESLSSVAQSKFDAAWSAASLILYGTVKPASDNAATAVQQKYAEAVSAASVAVYGTPTPAVESMARRVGEAGEEKYDEMKAFISELISGKEPSFTESVMSRFSSQWYSATPIATHALNAAKAAGEAYDSATSTAVSLMTPPPQLESILAAASAQIQVAVTAASEALYGTQKGEVEKITSSANAAAQAASSAISSIIHGREAPAAEKVQKDIIEALSNAREQLSIAIMGTPQGRVESVTSVMSGSLSQATEKAAENVSKAQEAVADGYSAVSKAVEENASAASSYASEGYSRVAASLSTMFYGPERSYYESAQSRLDAAIHTASAQLKEIFLGRELSFGERVQMSVESAFAQATSAAGEMYDTATSAAGEMYDTAASAAQEAFESASSVVSKAAEAVNPQEPEGVTGTVSSVASSIASEVKSKVAKLKDEL